MQEFLGFLEQIGVKKLKKKGAILFYEGEKAQSFFILLSGVVRIYKSTQNDRQITLHRFTPPNFIAEMPAIKGLKYPANAECESDCELLEISKVDFEKLCKEKPEFSILLIEELFEKIKILEKKLAQNALPLRLKLFRYLLENENSLHLISQKQIAIDLNIRAESLSRIIKELKEQGIIDTKSGKIVLLSKDLLSAELW